MTVLHSGSTEEYQKGWDNIFSKDGAKKKTKKAKKKTATKKKAATKKKKATKKK